MEGSGAGTRPSLRPMTNEQALVVERVCAALGVDEGMACIRQALALGDAQQLPAERAVLIAFVQQHLRAALQGESAAMLESLLADLTDYHAPDAMLRQEPPLPGSKDEPPSSRRRQGAMMRVLVVRHDALTRAHMSQSLLSSGFDVESIIADDLACLAEPLDVFHAIIVDLEVLAELVPLLPCAESAPTILVRTRGHLSDAKTAAHALGMHDAQVLSETAPIATLVTKLREAMSARGLRGR